MATYRIGIGSFNLKDGAVGIGTESSGLGNLKVEGTYKTTDLDVTGVSTFTRYAGFAADNINVSYREDLSLTGEHRTQGDIVVGLNSTFTVSTGATVTVGTVESVSIGTHFSPPIGGMNDRLEVPVEGTVRFNIDLGTLEFYNGVEWRQFTVNGASGRGLWGSGSNPDNTSEIDYITITSKGNAKKFGDRTVSKAVSTGMSNGIRGLFSGGSPGPSYTVVIDYVKIASEGNAADFGDLTQARSYSGSVSSSTRGIVAGGYTPSLVNTIDYVEIATIGDAIDFGDVSSARLCIGSCQSPTRGVFGGGWRPAPALRSKVIDYITISSKGNTINFGDLTQHRSGITNGGNGNSVRGIFAGGYTPVQTNVIDYVTIASEGNASDFGDATFNGSYRGGVSTNTRSCFGGGFSPSLQNIIDYIEIATTGDAMDFGDLMQKRNGPCGVSDSHGGLGGY